jgi:hypothetical protein
MSEADTVTLEPKSSLDLTVRLWQWHKHNFSFAHGPGLILSALSKNIRVLHLQMLEPNCSEKTLSNHLARDWLPPEL